MAYTKIIVSTCNAHISLFSPVLPLHVFLWKFIKMFNKQQVSIEFLQNLFIRFHIRCTKHHSQDLRQFSLPKSKFYYIFFVDEFANNFGWYFCGKKCILLFFFKWTFLSCTRIPFKCSRREKNFEHLSHWISGFGKLIHFCRWRRRASGWK